VISLRPAQTVTQQAIQPQVAALTVIGQLLSRQIALDAAEFPVLRALGLPPRRLAAAALAPVTAVTVAGRVAASPLMPIEAARLAEPEPVSPSTWPSWPAD
jgi:hypothetical protein